MKSPECVPFKASQAVTLIPIGFSLLIAMTSMVTGMKQSSKARKRREQHLDVMGTSTMAFCSYRSSSFSYSGSEQIFRLNFCRMISERVGIWRLTAFMGIVKSLRKCCGEYVVLPRAKSLPLGEQVGNKFLQVTSMWLALDLYLRRWNCPMPSLNSVYWQQRKCSVKFMRVVISDIRDSSSSVKKASNYYRICLTLFPISSLKISTCFKGEQEYCCCANLSEEWYFLEQASMNQFQNQVTLKRESVCLCLNYNQRYTVSHVSIGQIATLNLLKVMWLTITKQRSPQKWIWKGGRIGLALGRMCSSPSSSTERNPSKTLLVNYWQLSFLSSSEQGRMSQTLMAQMTRCIIAYDTIFSLLCLPFDSRNCSAPMNQNSLSTARSRDMRKASSMFH